MFASCHFFASINEKFAAAIVVERVWMVSGVLVHSASLQRVLENNSVILKWVDVFSGGTDPCGGVACASRGLGQ